MDRLADLLRQKKLPEEQQRYITQEFQDYGYRLACELGEETRKAMYIRLAKTKPRALLEVARTYVTDYPHAQNRGKLFLWKIKELERAAGIVPTTKPRRKKAADPATPDSSIDTAALG